MFNIGDKIVYPMHGAGVIRAIEEKKILGETKEYYIMKLPFSDMCLMAPVKSQDGTNLRTISDRKTFEEALKVLKTEPTEMDSNWNRRYRDNIDRLRTGDIFEVAGVVRNLVMSDKTRHLSQGERKLMNDAKLILLSEFILVMDVSAEEAERAIMEAIG